MPKQKKSRNYWRGVFVDIVTLSFAPALSDTWANKVDNEVAAASTVTRLGEFSPIGRLFTIGSLFAN
jgi:aminoglycoside N3'-acetyltransferase